MLNSLRDWVVIILLVAAMVLYPTLRMAEKTDQMAADIATQAMREFVNVTRGKGYIDNRDYTEFQKKLSATGRTFEVSLEYYKKRYQPLYDDPNDFYTFKDSYEVLYDGYYTNTILDVLFPKNSSLPQDSLERRFNMRAGDMINVRIESIDKDPSAMLRGIFLPNQDIPIADRYGGMIVNEAP